MSDFSVLCDFVLTSFLRKAPAWSNLTINSGLTGKPIQCLKVTRLFTHVYFLNEKIEVLIKIMILIKDMVSDSCDGQ